MHEMAHVGYEYVPQLEPVGVTEHSFLPEVHHVLGHG